MSMGAADDLSRERWRDAWPDALAFAAGLAFAWATSAKTADLVWSLWLASLTVGYMTIVWGAFTPAVVHFRERAPRQGVFAIVGGLGLIAFFTVHFGIFHAAHAAILGEFLPLLPGHKQRGFIDFAVLGEAARRYGIFVPAALLAERRIFRMPVVPPAPPAMSVKAADIAARKARQAIGSDMLFRPYLNVMRFHLLIFAFAAIGAAGLASFGVFAFVYAVYFLPWRLVFSALASRERRTGSVSIASSKIVPNTGVGRNDFR